MNPAEHLILHYKKADRIMLAVIWLLLLMAFGLATMHDTLVWVFAIAVPLTLLCTACAAFLPGRTVTRMLMAASLMIFTGLHIHQANGVTELHFGVFVLLAVLLCYRDWLTILMAAAVIAVHHLS